MFVPLRSDPLIAPSSLVALRPREVGVTVFVWEWDDVSMKENDTLLKHVIDRVAEAWNLNLDFNAIADYLLSYFGDVFSDADVAVVRPGQLRVVLMPV